MFVDILCSNTKTEVRVLRVAITNTQSKQLKRNNTKHKIVMSAL